MSKMCKKTIILAFLIATIYLAPACIPDEVLTADEILNMAKPLVAANQSPRDRLGGVDTNAVLTWEVPGDDVSLVTCDVYLGTDPDMANNSKVATGIPAIGASFDPCGTGDLESNTQYYWRVDTVDAGKNVHKGKEYTFFTRGTVIDPDFVGWWKFDDETTTIATDSSGYNHTAYVENGATWHDGVMELDGVNDYIESQFLESVLAADTITVAARIKVESDTVTWWDPIVRCSGVWNLDTAADTGNVMWDTDASKALWSATDIKDGQWHQVVGVYDGPNKKVRIYVDGNMDASKKARSSVLTTEEPCINIGDGRGDKYLKGSIDEVRVYTRVLSEPEIRAISGIFVAYNPAPGDGARGIGPNVVLSWEVFSSDPFTYDVYFGTDPDMANNPKVATGLTEKTFNPCVAGNLDDDTMYYWRVDVNSSGKITTGDVRYFTTMGSVIDSSLVGWWKLDETSGSVAKDSSGYGNAGVLQGNMDWSSSGYVDGAADFAYFASAMDCGNAQAFDISDGITVAAWLKPHQTSLWWNNIVQKTGSWAMMMNADAGSVLWQVKGAGDRKASTISTLKINDGLWHHIAGVYNGSAVQLYVDGVLNNSKSRSLKIATGDSPVTISKIADSFNGLVDEVRIYNRALNSSEIMNISNYTSFNAGRPNPADGAPSVDPKMDISWFAGSGDNTHDVYFGTNFDAVNNADNTLPAGSSVYKGNQALKVNSYDPGTLEWGRTYYWRIDEVNASQPCQLRKGRVWSFTADSGTASNPGPVDGAAFQAPDADINWSNGIDADTHDVYFGTNFDAVNNADKTLPAGAGVYKGNHALKVNSYDPGPLEWGRTYYWRIDEVNASHPKGLRKGNVWHFTVRESLMVDDFKDYKDTAAMLVNWAGEKGATLTLSPIHQDYKYQTAQSMMITYDNTADPYYSEAGREYATAQDWDSQGFETLHLWFLGTKTNGAERMYLKLEDDDPTSHTALIEYAGGANSINVDEWRMWTIKLDDLRTAGLNLAKVKKMSIGIGDNTAGGQGSVYIDLVILNKPTYIGQSADGSNGVRREFLDDYVYVCTDGGNGGYEGFPSVVRLMDGRLMAGFSDAWVHNGRSSTAYPNGARASYCTSSDEGQTWSEPTVIFDSPYADSGNITQLSTGRLICISTYSESSGADPWGVNVLWSDDGGETWTEPVMVAENYWSGSTQAIELSTGRIVQGLYYESNSGTGTGAVMYSDDNAETWSEVIDIPNGGVYLAAETGVIELNDGRLFAAMRGGSGADVHSSISEDQGQTWSVSKPMGFRHNGRPCLWRVHDDDGDIIVMGNRASPGSGTILRYSLDECQTWSDLTQVDWIIGAYPSMVTLNDGSILMVYYVEDDLTVKAGKQANIRARRFTVTPNGVRFLRLGKD